MLVLGRLQGQSIQIGADITVTILQAGAGGYVKIGIEAPRNIPISRPKTCSCGSNGARVYLPSSTER